MNEVQTTAEVKAAPVNPGVKTDTEKVNPEVKPVNPLAEQFQRIAKQEKFVQSERQKLEESKKQLSAEKEMADNYKSLKGKNPFEILEHFGISYDQLLQADKERTNPVDPKVREALKKVQELEAKMSEKENEAKQAQLSKAEIQIKSEIDETIRSKEYDLIEKLDAKDAVLEYMEEIFETSGTIPTVEEACEAVTTYLVDKYSSVKDSKWLQPKAAPEVVQEEVKPVKESVSPLSNKMVQTSEVSTKPLTESQRLQAAIAAMNASSTGRKR